MIDTGAVVRRRILIVMAGLLTLVCIATSDAHAQEIGPASASNLKAVVRLPVVDGRDIRFLPFAVTSFDPLVSSVR